MVMAGDQIISIDGQGANKISADEAYQIMELAPDPVRVTIKKDEQVTGSMHLSILTFLFFFSLKVSARLWDSKG